MHKYGRQCDGFVFVEQGMGPSKRNGVADETLAAYNDDGGGRFWKWYAHFRK